MQRVKSFWTVFFFSLEIGCFVSCAGHRRVVGGSVDSLPVANNDKVYSSCTSQPQYKEHSLRPEHMADVDLNGDTYKEWVRALPDSCDREGNCVWQIWELHRSKGCLVFRGEVRGSKLQRNVGTAHSYVSIYGWWAFPGGSRYLRQGYVFSGQEYKISSVEVCRIVPDIKEKMECTIGVQ